MSEPVKAQLLGRVFSDVQVSSSGYFDWKGTTYHVDIPHTWGLPWRDDKEDELVHLKLPDGTELIGSIHFER